jgi:hypothetical protein
LKGLAFLFGEGFLFSTQFSLKAIAKQDDLHRYRVLARTPGREENF